MKLQVATRRAARAGFSYLTEYDLIEAFVHGYASACINFFSYLTEYDLIEAFQGEVEGWEGISGFSYLTEYDLIEARPERLGSSGE